MAHTTAHTTELPRLLWRGGEYGYFWRLSDKRAHWLSVGALDNGIDLLGPGWEQDVFYGVHPTHNARGAYERGRAEDIAAINCLFADFDDPDALPRIESLQPAPQVVISSGKGFHAYWLLAEPVILSDDVTRRDWAEIQRWWVRHVGADPSACDLARVLRVPGTRNGKYDPPRPVRYVRCELDRPYDNQELMRHILDARTAELERVSDQPARVEQDAKPRMPAPLGAKQKRAVGTLLHWLAQQRPGNRNCATYWAAHRLREAGVTLEHAQALLVPLAVALGLPAREAERTIASAYRGWGA